MAEKTQKMTNNFTKEMMVKLQRIVQMSAEKAMAPHSSTLALKIPWMEELGAGYYLWGLKEFGHD